MKKYHLYLWIIALVGLITSCGQDEAAGPQNETSNRVRIGANIDQALQTRAASVTIPGHHQLRYVLEVWSTGTGAACIYRDEKTATTADAMAFDFTLSEAGDYKALLWADFVSESASTTQVTSANTYTHYADLHYKTNSATGLKAVTLAKTGTNYVINDDARDAFFACIPIKKETGAFEENVELTRPFGQINVIEKNANLLAKVASMTLAYAVPDYFNVETGEPSRATGVTPRVSTLPTATADSKANLFYDYIFAPATGQTTLNEIRLVFASNDSHVTLPDYTIPANMPVVRNKRTNINGSILTANSNDVTLTVSVSDRWTEPDNTENLPEPYGWYTNDKNATTFTLSTVAELREFANLVNGTDEAKTATGATAPVTFKNKTVRIADGVTTLDLNNEEWTPIGIDFNSGTRFEGTFDGRGVTVKNMKVSSPPAVDNYTFVGFFGGVNGNIKNLIVDGTVTITASGGAIYAGGICGYIPSGKIEFCRFSGTVSSTSQYTGSSPNNYAGGIAGQYPNILCCISDATVTQTTTGNSTTYTGAGGLLGGFYSASVFYSAWNSSKTAAMIGNTTQSMTTTGTESFTDINGLNGLLQVMNANSSNSEFIWQADPDGGSPVLVKR